MTENDNNINGDNNEQFQLVSLNDLHHQMMEEDSKYAEHYNQLEPSYSIISAMLDAKNESGMTLEQIAERMGTSKSALSRMLAGHTIPNWKTVMRFGDAVGKKAVIDFL